MDFGFGNLKDLISILFILLYDMVYWRLCDLHGSRILSGGEMRRFSRPRPPKRAGRANRINNSINIFGPE